MSDPADPAEPAPTRPPSHPARGREVGAKPEFRRYVWQRRWFQTLLAALVIFLVLSYVVPGVLGMMYAVRSVLVPVLIGLALAYILNPALRFAEAKLRVGRLAGTISLMLLALVVVMIIMVTAVPTMYTQGSQLFSTIQEWVEQFEQGVADEADGEPSLTAGEANDESGQTITDDSIRESNSEQMTTPASDPATQTEHGPPTAAVDSTVSAATDRAQGEDSWLNHFIDSERNREILKLGVERLRGLDGSVIAGWAMQSLDIGVGLVGSAVSFTSYLALSAVIIAFCFFFFSWKFDAILGWFEPFIPQSSHDQTIDMLQKMDMAVSSFVRGRLIQSLVMMIILCIGWWWAGVPYWFLLGVLTGLMNLVPFLPAVGWLIALVLTVMTTLVNGGDFAMALIIWPSVAYFVAQGLDGWVVEPVVQGQATNLDPLSVMLVVLVGGTVAGLLGMLLAIPLAACVKILSHEMLLPKLRSVASEA